MTRHTIIVESELFAGNEMLVGEFRAQIVFDWVGDTCDGWVEPHYEDSAELTRVTQVDGNWLNPKLLDAWAREWLADAGDLDRIFDQDRSTMAEQLAAQRAMYARQGVVMKVPA